MEKECKYCGTLFVPKNGRHMFCSHICAIRYEHQVKETHEQKAIRNEKIAELREQNKSMSEIAEMFGLSVSAVQAICKGLGCGGARSNRRAKHTRGNQYSGKKEQSARKYIARHPGWEYIGGYTSCDGFMDIRHSCGLVVHKSVVSVRQSDSIQCPVCVKREKEHRREQEEAQRQEREEKRQEERRRKKLNCFSGETISFKVCVVCNSIFIGRNKRQRCCSAECTRKYLNQIASRNKDARVKGKVVDKDITLDKLYARDYGICHICGGLCDWDDIKTKDGYVIAGDDYPSIDHVVPLAHGGLHSWENVKLAHRICNTRKGASLAYLPRRA